ncbi:MAG: hypothetical protein B0A82_25845 [Alkalinema sp. CACIAM 70d]|nr:MAG: hypothetical protein B0A82_25845 [Alkalinema sp. CACIAM 70d]
MSFVGTNKFSSPRCIEFCLIIIALTAFFLINLITSAQFPVPWQDEVMFTDPAANFYFGAGFTSSAWICGAHSMTKFWACNSPLYPFLLKNWMQLFGFSIASVRSLNYLLITIVSLLVWLTVVRLDLIRTVQLRITCLIIVLSGYGVSLIYRSGRYDCLALFLLAATIFFYTVPLGWLRYSLIVFIGILFPLAGLQLLIYSCILSGLLIYFFKKKFIKEIISLGIGLSLGVAFLFVLYASNGVLQDFLTSVRGLSSSPLLHKVVERPLPERLPKDPSILMTIIAAISILIYQIKIGTFSLKSLLSFTFISSLVIPGVMFCLGQFPTYYSWMIYIPLSVAICSTIESIRLNTNRLIHFVVVVSLIFSCLIGLPLQLASAVYYWEDRDSSVVDSLISRNVNSEDWVYASYNAYFSIKKRTLNVFIPFQNPPLEYRKKISVLIIEPELEDFVTDIVGGVWKATDDMITPKKGDLVKAKFAILLQRTNHLRVYRKIID